MTSRAVLNFMRQQGFPEEPADACNMHFAGLYFQPRIMFGLVLIATLLQSGPMFLVMSGILWWNVLLPRFNPFEVTYNRFVAPRRGGGVLAPAPGPRRFAQGMAAVFMLAAGLALRLSQPLLAYVCEAALIAAFSMLLFGKFCMGAYIFHLLRGEVAFANSTLPWARPRT
jgi:hypothetical protein